MSVRVDAGPLEAVPSDRCVAVGDGRAVIVKVDGAPVAFANRCLHQASELAGGRVLAGRLTCPQHFWRYDLPGGRHIGNRGCLVTFPTEVVDGHVIVELPEPEPAMSMRERLLAHAREWDRGG